MGDGKKTTSMAWFLGQIGGHKREYVWSVILAIVGVGFSIVPYFFAIKVINGFMRGEKNIGFYLRYSILWRYFGQVGYCFMRYLHRQVTEQPLLY